MFEKFWYRTLLLAFLLAPAWIFQSVWPLIPFATWEQISEPIYSNLLILNESVKKKQSRVIIVQADQATLDKYGWPLRRSLFTNLLEKLQNWGHPWILSLFLFQEMDSDTYPAEFKKILVDDNNHLREAIGRYDRYVGTGLQMTSGEELTEHQEELLLQKGLISKDAQLPTELPYLPMTIAEDEQFVEKQRAFSFSSRFGTSRIISCQPLYIEDQTYSGKYVIPSSLVWVTALARGLSIKTASNATWPGGRAFNPVSSLQISYKQCLSDPSVSTKDYFRQNQIEVHSLASVLDTKSTQKWAGKVVILGAEWLRRFRGPGRSLNENDLVVPEHYLVARFLDGLLKDTSIRRDPLKEKDILSWMPLALGGFLTILSFVAGVGGLLLNTGGAICGLLVLSWVNLVKYHYYFVPVQTLASSLSTFVILVVYYFYLRHYAVRRQVRLSETLRIGFTQCNTFEEIKKIMRIVANKEFSRASIKFYGYDHKLYDLVQDPASALQLLQRGQTSKSRDGGEEVKTSSVITKLKKPAIGGLFTVGKFQVKVQIAIRAKGNRLGVVELKLSYKPFEEPFIGALIDILRIELSHHWYRVDLLAKRQLQDYQIILQQTRANILSKFLTKSLVARFADNATMEDNLRRILIPRKARVALLQADIRGYSKISANKDPLETVLLLQNYYQTVVDTAQTLAQVKLIGDCIFLFIEEGEGVLSSPVDFVLKLASILVQETEKQNKIMEQTPGFVPLFFGIGIHFGEAIVGNLSSENCIDYTVIGPNVNMVARIEEMTKIEKIRSLIGPNGVLFSIEAAENLRKNPGVLPRPINLREMDISIRSFPEVKELRYLTAEDLRGVLVN